MAEIQKIVAADFAEWKRQGRKIAMLTVYDAAFARMAEAAQIDMLLVGDSLANTMLGLERTAQVGMTEMLLSVAAVRRGAPNSFVVADFPYKADETPEFAALNAKLFRKHGASAVKIEGVSRDTLSAVKATGVPLVPHIGLLPQTAANFRQKGKTPEEAAQIFQDALVADSFDPCAIVVEHVPSALGERIAASVKAPVIGIGAGAGTDGQVLVLHDALGMHSGKLPPFARKFADMWSVGLEGMRKYKHWVSEQAAGQVSG
jgi:3-methyl-2-oxobutanoate hydroxymethyltransferase